MKAVSPWMWERGCDVTYWDKEIAEPKITCSLMVPDAERKGDFRSAKQSIVAWNSALQSSELE